MNKVSIKLLDPNAKIPSRGYPNSAGYDLFPLTAGIIPPGEKVNIPLGFATEFPPGYVAIVDDRGGIGNKCLTHLAGVIDSDYRGEWMVIMQNLGKEPYKYDQHKAIAQVLFLQYESPVFTQVEELSESLRGDGKFGSSEAKRVLNLSAGNHLKIGQSA